MMLNVQANTGTYTVLWGTQLAITIALAGVMGGLSLRLSRPLMQTLALHWLARLVIVLINLLYYVTSDPTAWWLLPFAGCFGTACAVLLITARQMAICAEAPRESLPPTRWALPLVVGTALALTAQLVNVLALDFSPAFAAIWTRGLYGVAYVCLIGWLALRWLDLPHARHRLTPLFLGAVMLFGFDLFDTIQRGILLAGGIPFGSAVWTIVGSLTGTLCLGLGSVLAALETERDALREQAERLRVAEREHAEAQRLQSLGQLASGVAHDFNNVLALIGNGIDFVGESLTDRQHEARRDLQDIRMAVDRGSALVRRLVAFSRPHANSPVPLRPADVLRECLPMLQRLLSSRLTLHATIEATQYIEIDRTQLEQLIINLLINARDAAPQDGGTVRLSVMDEDVAVEQAARIGRVTPGRWVRLSVLDDGIGINPAVLPNLFEPFFTTKGEKGTGLGLATVAAAVRDLHGAADVYSTPGRGTRFDVWFPVYISEAPVVPSAPPPLVQSAR
jgi:signal transduction histidine kinase